MRPIIKEDAERGIASIRLFMYATEDQLNSIIDSKKIRISCPWKTNDVTEGLYQGEYWQCENIKEYGYICMSANCQSPSMWGYYADSSRGACLVFDIPVGRIGIEKDFYILEQHNQLEWNGRKILRKVKYDSNREKRNRTKNEWDSLFIKDSDWKHEEEYRVLVNLSNITDCEESSSADNSFYSTKMFRYLRGVILGVRFSQETVEYRRKLKRLGVNLKVTRAALSKTKYKHEIDLDFLPEPSLPSMMNLPTVKTKLKESREKLSIPLVKTKKNYRLFETEDGDFLFAVVKTGRGHNSYELFYKAKCRPWYALCGHRKTVLEALYKDGRFSE